MKLFVCIFGTQRRIRNTSIVVATATGVAIKFFGAPPLTLIVVTYGGAMLVAMTQERMRRDRGVR